MSMPRPKGKAQKIADSVLKNKGVAAPKKTKRDKEHNLCLIFVGLEDF